MRAFVGFALILFSVYSLARPKIPIIKGGSMADGAVGVMSGFLGGSTGLAGHSRHRLGNSARMVKGRAACHFPAGGRRSLFLMTLGWFGATGMITADTVRLFLIGLPAVLLGTWLGFKLYGKLDDAAFRTIVLVLLLVSGLTLLPSAL